MRGARRFDPDGDAVKRSRAFLRHRRGNLDANHVPIRDGLIGLGHCVVDLAGVGDGVSDLWVKKLGGGAVWLEVKTLKGRGRLSQLAFKAKVEARGERYAVARTLDEAIGALQ